MIGRNPERPDPSYPAEARFAGHFAVQSPRLCSPPRSKMQQLLQGQYWNVSKISVQFPGSFYIPLCWIGQLVTWKDRKIKELESVGISRNVFFDGIWNHSKTK